MFKESKPSNQDKTIGMLVMDQYFMDNKQFITLNLKHNNHSIFKELSQLDKDQTLSRQKCQNNQF